MFNRKIVQHGSSTLTISLPYRWTQKYGLNKGDELALEPHGKNLLIKTDRNPENKVKSLSYPKNKIFLKRDLLNLYRQGYDEVVLKFSYEIPIAAILEQLDEILGFEIVEQTESTCIIRNVANVKVKEFDSMLKRLFILAHTFSSAVLEAIKEKNISKLQSGKSVERESNKLVNYCQRVLNKGDFEDITRITALFSLVDRLELINDSLGDISDYLIKKNFSLDNKTIMFFEELNNHFQDIYMQYFCSNRVVSELKKKRLALYTQFFDIAEDKKLNLIVMSGLKQVLEELHHIEVSL